MTTTTAVPFAAKLHVPQAVLESWPPAAPADPVPPAAPVPAAEPDAPPPTLASVPPSPSPDGFEGLRSPLQVMVAEPTNPSTSAALRDVVAHPRERARLR